MLAVTSIIKNREWILPYFLSCLHNLAYPRESTAIILYNDASTDNSLALMRAFEQAYKHEYHTIRIIDSQEAFDNNTSSRDPQLRDRSELYRHLVKLRNIMIDEVNAIGAKWQFSIDSDILFVPDIFQQLAQHRLPYVATLILNDCYGLNYFNYTYLKNRHVNFGNLEFNEDGKRQYCNYPYELNRLYKVDVSGACYLIDASTLQSGARFAYDEFGEDVGYCVELKEHAIQVTVDTTWKAVHAMSEKYLEPALEAFNRLMTFPVIAKANCDALGMMPTDVEASLPRLARWVKSTNLSLR